MYHHQQHEVRVDSKLFWQIRHGAVELPLEKIPSEFEVGNSVLIWERQLGGGITRRNEIRRIKEIHANGVVLTPWTPEGILPTRP